MTLLTLRNASYVANPFFMAITIGITGTSFLHGNYWCVKLVIEVITMVYVNAMSKRFYFI